MEYRITYELNNEQGKHIVQAMDEDGAQEVFSNDPVYSGARILSIKTIINESVTEQ